MQIMQYLEVLSTLQDRYSGWICSLGGGGVFAFSIRAMWMWVVGEKVLLVVVVVVIMA